MANLAKTSSRPEAGAFTAHLFPALVGAGGDRAQAAACEFRPSFGGVAPEAGFDSMPLCANGDSGPGADAADAEPSVDIAALEEAAFARGCEQGRREGLDAGRREVAPVIKQLRQIMADLQKAWTQLQGQAERDAVDLGLAVARKVIGREPSVSPELVLEVVKAAVAKVADQDRIRIRVNPADVEMVQRHDEAIGQWVNKTEALAIEADAGVAAGGCMVETDFGDVDARLDKQLEVIEAAFKAQLGVAQR